MIAALAITAALLAPTGDYGINAPVAPSPSQPVICDTSSTVPIYENGIVVCVAAGQQFGTPILFNDWGNGFGGFGGRFGGRFGGFGGRFGGFHHHHHHCVVSVTNLCLDTDTD